MTGHAGPGSLRVRKAVGLSADGPFVNILTVAPGTTVHYRITVTNTGNVALTGVTLSDNTFDLVAKGCTIPTTLAVGASFDCDYSSVSAETSDDQHRDRRQQRDRAGQRHRDGQPGRAAATPVLAINKTNNAPAAPGGAKEGDTVTFTLAYTMTDGPADTGDHQGRPPGRRDVRGRLGDDSENGEFVFAGYDSGDPHPDVDGRAR